LKVNKEPELPKHRISIGFRQLSSTQRVSIEPPKQSSNDLLLKIKPLEPTSTIHRDSTNTTLPLNMITKTLYIPTRSVHKHRFSD
jgi:hypothetical protein